VAISFAVLGRLEVHRAGERLRPLPPQQRLVLCLLLARANTVVSDDELADALWDGPPTGAHRQRLFEIVSRLREWLGTASGAGPITRSPGGYRLDVSAPDLDTMRFEQLRARGIVRCRDLPAQAVRDLEAAEALWRGRVVLRVDQDLHRPPALRGDRRPAHLRRQRHRDRQRQLPPRPHPRPPNRGHLTAFAVRDRRRHRRTVMRRRVGCTDQ
jgi:DNA-binding winged helix-turn-helix (wHTH) protein